MGPTANKHIVIISTNLKYTDSFFNIFILPIISAIKVIIPIRIRKIREANII